MNIRETRNELSKYSADILTAFATERLPTAHFAQFPANAGDLAGKAQFLIEYAQRKVEEAALQAFIDQRTPRLRRLLIEGFSTSDLYRFCYDSPSFKEIALNFGMAREKSAYIGAIIEECDRYPNKYQELWAWAKEQNPNRYMDIMWSW